MTRIVNEKSQKAQSLIFSFAPKKRDIINRRKTSKKKLYSYDWNDPNDKWNCAARALRAKGSVSS
jgi:hypothetical protein